MSDILHTTYRLKLHRSRRIDLKTIFFHIIHRSVIDKRRKESFTQKLHLYGSFYILDLVLSSERKRERHREREREIERDRD